MVGGVAMDPDEAPRLSDRGLSGRPASDGGDPASAVAAGIALRDVVSTLPARDLADCAMQVNVAGHMIMRLTCNDLEKPELDELADAIERIMVSVLPVMAAAAGLDLAEFALDEVANLHEGRFPELAR